MHRTIRSIGIGVAVLSAATTGQASAQRVSDLQVIPDAVSLGVGERKEVLAVAYGSGGDVMTRVTFNWAESDASVVRVEIDQSAPPGVAYLVGTGPGSATVTVKVGTIERRITVQVAGSPIAGPQGEGVATILRLEPQQLSLFPLEDVQLRPIFLKDDGSLAAYSSITWRSFRPDVAEVEQGGKVIGVSPGMGVIEATSATGLQARIQVQVAAAPWQFTVPVFALSPLQSDTVRIIVPSQNSRSVQNRWFIWGTSNPDVVTVSPLGVVTAISAGQAEIGATGFGQELRLPVRVHRVIESFLVRPRTSDTVVVPLGGVRRVEALPEASDQTIITDAPVNWIVGDSSVLSYSPSDTMAAGKAIGATTLIARAAGGMEATWNVKVVAAGLVLDHTRVGLSLDEQVTFSPSFADSAGNPLSPATDVTWSSSDEGVAQVSSAGTVTPVSRGRSEIVASTPWGVADTATVFVQGEILVTSTRNGTADIFAFDRTDLTAFTPITTGAGNELGGTYSPDGSRVIYGGDASGNFEIYVVDADGQNPQQLTTTPVNETEPVWTPDGRQIVYQSDVTGTLQIWIMDRDGANQRALTSTGPSNYEPAVSPDGTRIAFTSVRDGNYEIYIMDLDGSDQENLTQSLMVHERAPQWIDSVTIAYVREEREDRTTTWVVVKHRLGGEVEPLTQPTLVVTDFAIPPSGDLVAVTAQSPGPSGGVARRLFLLPLNGDTPIEVPRAGEGDQLVRPAFRP